jgi:hypothetical protein
MHTIEPHYLWRHLYTAQADPYSPFYGYENSEVYFTDKIYDHLIHPQWDNIGLETLFIKQLYADYSIGFTILEFLGEWNDVLHNDIMTLKRDVLEPMLGAGLDKFILLGEGVLNWHADASDYYEEWFEEIEEGWIAGVNFRPHVLSELQDYKLDYYINVGGELDELEWRRLSPLKLFKKVEGLLMKRLT